MTSPLPRTYVEHLVAPQRAGDVPDAEAAGQFGSMVGGLGVRVTLAYRDAGRGRAVIGRAAARCFGSVAPVAPASVLTGMLIGLSPAEALALTPEIVVRVLADGSPHGAGLPPRVVRGAEFVVEAARRALGAPGRAGPSDPCGPGILVCRCLDVGDRAIRRAIADGARTVEAVGDRCGASTGCRSCRPDILRILDEETEPAPLPPSADLPTLERIAWAQAGPLLRSLGMSLERAEASGDSLRLVLSAARSRPDVSLIGATAVVRHLFRETVGDQVRVEAEEVPPGWGRASETER
jgi:bacterioferritin-associated ferredoxin